MSLKGVAVITAETIKGLGRFSKAIIAFGVFPLFLPLMITACGGPESYFIKSLAIIVFGAFELIVPKYYTRLGKMDKKSLDSLI